MTKTILEASELVKKFGDQLAVNNISFTMQEGEDTTVSKGFWSIGIGLIFLGLNATRYLNGIRMSGFTTFIGILSLLGGVIQLLGWKEMDGAFFLILLGAYLILKPYFDKRQLFGKAEHNRS